MGAMSVARSGLSSACTSTTCSRQNTARASSSSARATARKASSSCGQESKAHTGQAPSVTTEAAVCRASQADPVPPVAPMLPPRAPPPPPVCGDSLRRSAKELSLSWHARIKSQPGETGPQPVRRRKEVLGALFPSSSAPSFDVVPHAPLGSATSAAAHYSTQAVPLAHQKLAAHHAALVPVRLEAVPEAFRPDGSKVWSKTGVHIQCAGNVSGGRRKAKMQSLDGLYAPLKRQPAVPIQGTGAAVHAPASQPNTQRGLAKVTSLPSLEGSSRGHAAVMRGAPLTGARPIRCR